MSIERWFRLTQYLTLGMACGALVFAEAPFLPDLEYCLAPVLALLFLAWWVEGRWILPNWGANILGLFIAAGGAIWLMMQLSDDEYVLANLPLHLALLPYMGPLAMALMLVKVFRTHDTYHFWHLQGLGLLQIGLGCLLDGGPTFGALMTFYLACDLVCLALHYRLSAQKGTRSEGRGARSEEREQTLLPSPLAPRPSPLSTPWGLFTFSLRWTTLVSATTLLLFWLTPHRDNWTWEPLNKLRSGYGHGRMAGAAEEMNLNQTGRIELDDEVALHVTAVDAAGNPKLDLPADQRWRGSVLDWYEHGKWSTMYLKAPPMPPFRQKQLPNFGPDQFFLTFTVQARQSGGLVLAEPIRFGRPFSPVRLPVVSLDGERRRPLFLELSGTVLPQILSEQRHDYRYRQVVPTRGDPMRIPADGLYPQKDVATLMTLPPSVRSPLQAWTVDLLSRLSELPRYQSLESVRADLAQKRSPFLIGQNHWELVARSLTDYLAHSGEYTYTLEITRNNRTLDPVLDFLMNVKQGHCERYAAALALMLRSVDIPARVVKGFRGCDSEGDGNYLVRHSHAHAWVEALAPGRRGSFNWLTLDATPPEPVATGHRFSLSYLWEEVQKYCLQQWRAMIVEYDGDEQADLWHALISVRPMSLLMKLNLAFLACGTAFVFWLILRSKKLLPSRLWQRRRTSTVLGDAALYPRLVRILGRFVSLRPVCGQTPREYGTAARTLLQTWPALAAQAELPVRVVELFYRARFGGPRLNEDERQQIDAELGRFTKSLYLAQPARNVSEGGPR